MSVYGTKIEWDANCDGGGQWVVYIDLPGWDGDDWIGGYDYFGEAAQAMFDAMIGIQQAAFDNAQARFRACEGLLADHEFRMSLVQARTQELGAIPREKPLPSVPRVVSRGVRRFQFACAGRKLSTSHPSAMWAALSLFFGRKVKDWGDLTAAQWFEAAKAVKAKKVGW